MLYPDYSGEHTRQSALETLIVVMKHTWPRYICTKVYMYRIREVSSFQRVLCTGFNGVGDLKMCPY